jgi:hypothetical protein
MNHFRMKSGAVFGSEPDYLTDVSIVAGAGILHNISRENPKEAEL